MNRKRDEESGRFETEYPIEDFLNAFQSDQFLSTTEVADRVGCTQNLAYRRLKQLEESGDVQSKNIGHSLAWQRIE